MHLVTEKKYSIISFDDIPNILFLLYFSLYVCAQYAYPVSTEARRVFQIPWNWSIGDWSTDDCEQAPQELLTNEPSLSPVLLNFSVYRCCFGDRVSM